MRGRKIVARSNLNRWLEVRSTHIGASEVPIILGLSPWCSPLELFARKIGALQTDETEQMRTGALLEKSILETWGTLHNLDVRHNDYFYESERSAFLGATPDGFVRENGNDLLVEVKLSGNQAFKERIPEYVWAQVQAAMYVMETNESFVIALVSPNIWYKRIEYDAKFFEGKALPHIKRFHESLEEGRFPGELTGPPESVKKALANLFPEDSGETIHLTDAHWIELHEERERLLMERKHSEHALISIENELRAAMKDATCAILGNGVRYSLKTISIPAKTIRRKAMQYRRLTCANAKGGK